ncbi:tRNA (guanosine(18)-2'-O)-methyltransferase [Vitis vinifera]|uniref:tRNA (Guanosine(18)-2'-O)-methyltransferase n=1 Tax=Vitis vinifera TaxID=29760 RepID=A0A438F6Q0_VITVI|nr:tRNA (guanosine(18)-2'-O)-methyltransferase [Vitis vinifera]
MVVESYVVVHNIAKRHNVGTLARSASALGVSELILVGRRDFNSFGSHGSTSHLRFRHFHSLLDARHFLKEKDCDICGVEITDNAVAVNQHPFKRSTAFLLGNEGTGLSVKECEICDFFVYIPQYGGGTASLNVTVAASIVLHHFGVARVFLCSIPVLVGVLFNCIIVRIIVAYALLLGLLVSFPALSKYGVGGKDERKENKKGFSERIRDGNKFVVAERPAQQDIELQDHRHQFLINCMTYTREVKDHIDQARMFRAQFAQDKIVFSAGGG